MTTTLSLDVWTGMLSRDFTDADGDHDRSEPVGHISADHVPYDLTDAELPQLARLRAAWGEGCQS